MAKMCAEIASEIPSISSPSVISSLVTSLGQLRYKNAGQERNTKYIRFIQIAYLFSITVFFRRHSSCG